MINCIRPLNEKLKPLKSGFIENSNFENIESLNLRPLLSALLNTILPVTACFISFHLLHLALYHSTRQPIAVSEISVNICLIDIIQKQIQRTTE